MIRMIRGVVNRHLEATVRLEVVGAGGQRQEVDAIIDTGFTGFLTLPSAVVTALALPWLCRQEGILADGSVHIFDVYVVSIVWDDTHRDVEVESAEADVLIGMGMLEGCDLRILAIRGGTVTIDRAV
jgi:clan AA aspartic protease